MKPFRRVVKNSSVQRLIQKRLLSRRCESAVKCVRKFRFEPVSFLFLVSFSEEILAVSFSVSRVPGFYYRARARKSGSGIGPGLGLGNSDSRARVSSSGSFFRTRDLKFLFLKIVQKTLL